MRLLALALLATVPAYAEDCSDLATQTDMNICADEAYQAADAHLNKLYKQISTRLKDSPETKSGLVAAQKAWIRYRDAECAFQASAVAGGSIAPMILAGCLEALTRDRAADFERLLSCEEGDLACPVPAP